MIVGYARASLTDRSAKFQIAAPQAAKCKRIFADRAGERSRNRPEQGKCLGALRRGDTLVLWRLDRLGRSLQDLFAVVERLRDTGIRLVSLMEKLDIGPESGGLILHIFAVLGECDRTLIRERTLAGLAAARAQGRFGGGRRKTTAEQDAQLWAPWEGGKLTGPETAKRFGISEPTFWRRVRAKRLEKKA